MHGRKGGRAEKLGGCPPSLLKTVRAQVLRTDGGLILRPAIIARPNPPCVAPTRVAKLRRLVLWLRRSFLGVTIGKPAQPSVGLFKCKRTLRKCGHARPSSIRKNPVTVSVVFIPPSLKSLWPTLLFAGRDDMPLPCASAAGAQKIRAEVGAGDQGTRDLKMNCGTSMVLLRDAAHCACMSTVEM